MSSISWCFEEARRRFESFAARDHKPLETARLGLGSPTQYKPVTSRGLMAPLNGTELKRASNWYTLTPEGVAEYRRRYPNSEAGEHTYHNGSRIS